MSQSHSYDWMRNEFMEAVRASMKRSDVEPIQKLFDSLPDSDTEKRAALDQGFRDYLLLLLGQSQPTIAWQTFLSRCVDCSRREMATVTMPVVLLGDIFDCLTLDQCEQLFTFVEDGVLIWKENLFFAACKNNLLRMCNDLLRRLSRSQNTIFCGRILLFLAKFFPFSERSGLNIISEFNAENVTDCCEWTETLDETLDEKIDEHNTEKFKIDHDFYSKFWELQESFRNPLSIFNKTNWKTFVTNSENVLGIFKSLKLEGVQNKELTKTHDTDHVQYFPKFLTSPKLLELQLSDVNFRRFVLVQFIILFQYLMVPVKFKSNNQELKPNEKEWVKETTERVYSLLRETPPDGEIFTNTVQQIFKREEFWNNWKNDGCPALKRPEPMDDDEPKRSAKRSKKRMGQIIKEAHSQGKYIMGNQELTTLWNFAPENLEACRAPERNFLMSLEDYFSEAIEQLDPAAMVESQYKIVNDGNFGWRALRLLALQSSHFFTQHNNPINKLSEYLEIMIKKIAKERPIILPCDEEKQDNIEVTETNTDIVNEAEAEAEEDDELLKGDEKRDEINNEEREIPDVTVKPQGITSNVLFAAAQGIDSKWQELADKMGFKDSIQYIEESLASEPDLKKAHYILQLWIEEDSDLTVSDLAKALEKWGFLKSAAVVKSMM